MKKTKKMKKTEKTAKTGIAEKTEKRSRNNLGIIGLWLLMLMFPLMAKAISGKPLVQMINLSVLTKEELKIILSRFNTKLGEESETKPDGKLADVKLEDGKLADGKLADVKLADVKLADVVKEEKWSKETLDEILRALVSEMDIDIAYFEKKITDTAVVFELQVVRSQRIKKIEIKGNTFFSNDQIMQVMDNREGGRFHEGALGADGEKIVQLYENEGFRNTQLRWNKDFQSPSEMKLTLYLEQGVQTFVKKVKVLSENIEFNNKLYSYLKEMEKKPLSKTLIQLYKVESRGFFSKNRYFHSDLPEPRIVYNELNSEAELSYHFARPLQYFIDFDGNWRVSEQELRTFLKLDEFQSSSSRVGSELTTRVKNYYLSKGYAKSEIHYKESTGSTPFLRIIQIGIKEGELIRIKNINFQGHMSLKSEEYVKILMSFSSGSFAERIYVKEEIDKAVDRFLIDRQNQGYFKARILSLRTAYNEQKNGADLFIQWDEGPMTVLEKVILEGNKSFPDTELLRKMGLNLKEPLKLMELEKGLDELKKFYYENGFLEMNITNEKTDLVNYSEGNTQVQLRIKIFEGPKIVVGSILVDGNTITKESVILKEIEFREGDVLTPQILNESIGRLQRLGFFTSVEIKTLEENTMQSVRTVLIQVIDRNPGLFEIGVGFNNERGITLRGYAGIGYRNIGGWGRGISARSDVKYNVSMVRYLESKVSLGYLEPYLFDTRIKGRINLTRSVFISDFDVRKASQVNQITYSLEQDITTHLFASWDVWSLATIRDFYIDSNEDIQLLDIATTTPSLTYDYRDNPFNPNSGFIAKVSVEHSNPRIGSTRTIDYNKYYTSFTHYLPIYKSGGWGWIWANGLRWGYLVNNNNDEDGGVPYDKKGLTLGGQSTIRGYAPDEAFPNKYELGSDLYKLRSRATMKLIKSELRFPLSRFNSWDLFGAIFYDGGSVEIQGLSYSPTYRHSAGFAVRANFPVGAIGLDFGWKLNPQGSRHDNPMVINLEVGTF